MLLVEYLEREGIPTAGRSRQVYLRAGEHFTFGDNYLYRMTNGASVAFSDLDAAIGTMRSEFAEEGLMPIVIFLSTRTMKVGALTGKVTAATAAEITRKCAYIKEAVVWYCITGSFENGPMWKP